ncbi:hypothetical protein N431DRAFT_469125 [Stipitochalara longipes BDJ]|nr:hypothetical protein N431DRAFT_469125 [Stipitochalara longipes BDJ]
MSFGFGIGDFVTLLTLTVSLYRSFKNAPDKFDKIGRLQGLSAEPESTRGQELSTIRGNLVDTVKDLEDLHKKYQKMGQLSWSRFKAGQEDLSAMGDRLTAHVSALNAFMGSLAIASLGRMEPMLQRIHDLIDEQAKGNVAIAESVLDAAEDQ